MNNTETLIILLCNTIYTFLCFAFPFQIIPIQRVREKGSPFTPQKADQGIFLDKILYLLMNIAFPGRQIGLW